MKKLIIIILAIVALSTPSYACGKWALSGSRITGSQYGGGVVNRCYYQDLTGSGETMSVEMPMGYRCNVLLDPCPEGGESGSNTQVIITQNINPNPPSQGMEKLNMEKLRMKKISE